jgi:hypothetical protein
MKRTWWVWLTLVLGSLLIGIGLLAPILGLEAESGFGPRRAAMIALGGAFLVWVISYPLLHLTQAWIVTWYKGFAKPAAGVDQKPATDEPLPAAHSPSQFPWMARHVPDLAFTGALMLGVWSALWVFTAGKMTVFPIGTRYYHQLSEAFRNGQLHLLVEPDTRLADLENPYDLRQRRNIPVVWDASYYDGKYYLYWGPVPGVIAAGIEQLVQVEIRDPELVLFFVLGTILFSLLAMRAIWKRAVLQGGSDHSPAWILFGGMLALGVNAPLIWLLTRPSVYEAAIAGGQCFLMAGLSFALSGFFSPRSSVIYLLLAGSAFALAAGTRANLLLAILFLSGMALWWVYQSKQKNVRKSLPAWLGLTVPLLIGLAAISRYNNARFGSILESGHRFQLTGLALPEDYGLVTSFRYILPNLYSYLARLPLFELRFPFLSVPWVKEGAWPGFIPLPESYYYTEPVAGLISLVPVIGLAGLIALGWFYLIFHRAVTLKSVEVSINRSWLPWLTVWLGGAAMLELLVLLVFISSSLRYLADLAATWILLATVFSTVARSHLTGGTWRRLITFAWLAASGMTVLFGLLVGLTGYTGAFRDLNPTLYQRLIELFR